MRWVPLILAGLLLAACGADEPSFDAAADRAAFAKAKHDARERYVQQRIDAETLAATSPRYNTMGYFTGFTICGDLQHVNLDDWLPPVKGEYALSAAINVDANITAGLTNECVRIDIHNLCSMPVRIPGGSATLEVRQAGADYSYGITKRSPVTFTILVTESAIEIPAYGYHSFSINAYDGENWIVPYQCWTMSGTVEYRARLEVRASEHQQMRNLTACDARSPWYPSTNPRKWLPDHATYDMFKGRLG